MHSETKAINALGVWHAPQMARLVTKVSQTPGENPFSAGASLEAAGQLHGGWLVPPSGRGQKASARAWFSVAILVIFLGCCRMVIEW